MCATEKLYFNIDNSVFPNFSSIQGRRRLKDLRAIIGYQKQDDDTDSWLNIKDEDDPRGRVGVSWPWEQSNDKGDDRK